MTIDTSGLITTVWPTNAPEGLSLFNMTRAGSQVEDWMTFRCLGVEYRVYPRPIRYHDRDIHLVARLQADKTWAFGLGDVARMYMYGPREYVLLVKDCAGLQELCRLACQSLEYPAFDRPWIPPTRFEATATV